MHTACSGEYRRSFVHNISSLISISDTVSDEAILKWHSTINCLEEEFGPYVA